MIKEIKVNIYDAERWGLSSEAIGDLGNKLHSFWKRFKECFTTKTRDTSSHALTYLKGMLGMDTKRNYANIARHVIAPEEDGQNL